VRCLVLDMVEVAGLVVVDQVLDLLLHQVDLELHQVVLEEVQGEEEAI
jgi:hypothetical protein